MTAPEPKKLGRYDIVHVLGRGAMGVVYEGFDSRLNRRVAIKTILKSHLDERTAIDYSQRFVREAQAVARLNHPNIVQVHDFGDDGEVAYLVMEFIKGKELRAFFDAQERFDLKEAVRIMGELCDALDFAHEAGIIHRDVKPGNVMLDSQMRVKLTDFGVARVQDVARSHATAAGTLVGTPAYMAPEQIAGAAVDRRTDVFSAGIILYEFLTGEMPFTGRGAWTVAKKIMQDEPRIPSSINTSINPFFDKVVNRALAKNPDQRYQSARGLGAALERALEGKADEVDPDTTVVQAAATTKVPGSFNATPTWSAGIQDAEVEFWRSIKDGEDPHSFELYVEQFPNGVYAKLARHKITTLRGSSTALPPVPPLAEAPPPVGPAASSGRRRIGIAAAAGLAIAVAAVAVWFFTSPSSSPVATTASQRAAPPAVSINSTEEHARLAQERAAAEKALKEQADADRLEAEKVAADKAADKAAAEQARAEKIAAEKAAKAQEKEAKAKAAAAEKAAKAQEKEARERAAAELARLEKARTQAAAKPAAPQDAQPSADRSRTGGRSPDEINRAGNDYYGQKKYAEAVQQYRIAADLNHPGAQGNLGVMYERGWGVDKDYAEAARWYRKAADQNHAQAQNYLGNLYRNGWGVSKDYGEAIKWHRKAADQHLAIAQNDLGWMYQHGLGVGRDYAEAMRWYRKAADQNNAVAQSNVGSLYQGGWGVPRDDVEALRWFRKSADQNHPVGLEWLGFMHENGLGGLLKDLDDAGRWYSKAAEQGNENAKKALQRLQRFR